MLAEPAAASGHFSQVVWKVGSCTAELKTGINACGLLCGGMSAGQTVCHVIWKQLSSDMRVRPSGECSTRPSLTQGNNVAGDAMSQNVQL